MSKNLLLLYDFVLNDLNLTKIKSGNPVFLVHRFFAPRLGKTTL